MLYYHFSSDKPSSSNLHQALRAILTQLVHECRYQTDLVDVFAVLIESRSIGQITASDDEVFQALALLLTRLTDVALLFDGVDECADVADFLTQIYELSNKTQTKLLLLGRPNVEIPRLFRHYTSFHMNQAQNLDDIRLFLTPEISYLQEEGLISKELSLDRVISTLAARARGMFLWAWLMVRYLECKALLPYEREDAIFAVELVEGLEAVYEKILTMLAKQFRKSQQKVEKIFALLVAAPSPPSVTQLQIALAIEPEEVTKDSRIMRNLGEDLPIICNSLVEVDKNNSVRFLHGSFRDFLTDPEQKVLTGPFFVNENHAHLKYAILGLSHILYDIPRGPLDGNGRASVEVETLNDSFPFLEIALRWVYHARLSFRERFAYTSEHSSVQAQRQFFSLVSRFLDEKLTVTTWIEAIWSFKLSPSLDELVDSLSVDGEKCPDILTLSNNIYGQLRKLSEDLNRLNSEWGHLLEPDPGSIWRSSMTAFTSSTFWNNPTSTTVTSLVPSELSTTMGGNGSRPKRCAILVQSQVSDSGEILGIVLVFPSRYARYSFKTLE